MPSRRRIRELVLACCYEIEVGKQDADRVLRRVSGGEIMSVLWPMLLEPAPEFDGISEWLRRNLEVSHCSLKMVRRACEFLAALVNPDEEELPQSLFDKVEDAAEEAVGKAITSAIWPVLVNEGADEAALGSALAPTAKALCFLIRTVREVQARSVKLDEIIRELARGWRLERIARIDLAILRSAIVELVLGTEEPPAPDAVVINEAVVLAKKFSTADSGKFINGILASVVSNKAKYRQRLLEDPD